MSYYVIIPYSYIMRILYEKEVFLLLVVFGVGTQQDSTHVQLCNEYIFIVELNMCCIWFLALRNISFQP